MTRTRLLLGTALAAALLATPALAQFPFITNVDVTAGGAAPTITDSANLRIVTLNAPRTYLDHGLGFFLSSGTTLRFDFANPGPGGVALLRADSGITILGTVEGRLGPGPGDTLGGNLWFFSRGGILLAEGGRVAAGGILLSNALPELLTTPAGRQQLLANDALVIEANLGPLLTTGTRILLGASVEASEGYLAIISQNVEQGPGTDIRAARGTVLVGAANSYTIRLARNASNDFDLVEFEVPAGGGTDEGAAPIDLAGSVRGGNVWLSLVGSVDLTSALIRATGTIVASAATLEQGQIVLSAGSGIVANAPGPPQDAASTRIRAELADLAADGDIRIRQDEGELSTAVAGGDIRIETREIVPAGTTALGSLEAGGSIFVNVGGNVTASAPVTAGGDIIVRGAGAVTLGTLSAGDDIVAVAGGLLLAGDTGTTIESRNEGPDVTRDGDDTDPSGDFAPVRSIYLESTSDRVLLQGLLTGFTEGTVRSALAPDINVDTGPNPIFLGGGLSVTTADLGTTTRITLTDSVSGPGLVIYFSEIVSGPLRLRALGEVSIGQLSAVGFAGVEAAGGVIVGDARVAADHANSGSLALASDAGSVSLGGADVDGDLILVARQGSVRTLIGANIRFGDDLYAISGRGVFGQGITFNPGTSIASKPGFPDVAGNEILDNGDPSLLVPDFGRDVAGNGRVAELLALAQFGQFPPGVSGDVLFNGQIANLDRLGLVSDSVSIRVLAPDSRLAELSASAALDVELSAEAIEAPFFTAGRDALLTLSGADPVTIVASAAGRDLSITAGGPLSLESTSVGRDLTMTAPEIRLGPLPGSPRNVTLSTRVQPFSGAIEAGDITATGTIRLGSLAGTSVLGNLTAGADIIVETGFITLGNLTAAGNILMEVNGLAANLLTAGGAIGIASQAGDIILAAAEAGGDVTMFGEGASRIEAGGVTSTGGDIELSAAEVEADVLRAPDGSIRVDGRAGPARLGADGGVAAGLDIEIRAVGLDLLELDAGRDLLLEARGPEGDILGEGFAAVRDLTLIAGRDADLVRATAGRNLSVTAARDARLAESSAGQDIAVLAPEGAAVLDGLDAGRDLSARGGALSLNAVAAGRDIDLETTREDLLLASEIAAVGNLRLVSAAALTAEGPLSAGGAVTLRARDDAPSGILQFTTVTAGGDLDARAWTVRGARLTAGGSARVVGTGPGSIEADEIVADDDVDLTSPSIRVGFVRSTGLGPDVDGDGFNVRLAGGLGEFIAIEAPTDIRARMTGQLAIADAIAGRDADLEAGSIRIQPRQTGLVAGRDARLVAATTLAAGRVSAGDDVTMEAGGAATLGTVEARGDGEDAEGDGANIRLVSAGADALALAAPGDIIVNATTGPAVLGQDGGVAAGRDLLVAGTTLDLVGTGSGRDLRLTATAGDITGPGFTAVRDLALSAAGRIEVSTAAAGRDLDLAAEGDLEILDTASAGRDARLLGGSVTGPLGFPFLISAERDISIESTAGPVSVRATAGDDVRVRSAGILRLGAITTGAGEDTEGDGSRIVAEAAGQTFLEASTAAGDLDLTAGGPVQGQGTPVAGGSLRISGTEVQLPLGATAGLDAEIRATGGLLFTAGLVRAEQDVRLVGADGDLVNVGGTGLSAGRDIAIAGDGIAVSSGAVLAAGRDARLTGTGFIGTRQAVIEAGRDIEIATDGGINFGRLVAGDDIRVASRSNLVLGDEVLTTGLGPDDEGDGSTVRMSGTFVEVAAGESAGDMLLTGRDAVFAGFRDGVAVPPGLSAGRDLVIRSGNVQLNLAGLGRNLDVEASTGGLDVAGAISAPGAIRLDALLAIQVPGGITAGTDVDLRSRVSLVRVEGPVTAGRDVALEAGGALETGAITAPGSLAARAARMAIGGATVGGGAALETTAGELALGPSVTTGGDLLLRAPELPGGIIRIDRIAAGGAVDARAFSILSAPGGGFVTAAGPVRMVGTGAQSIDLEEVISDDDVDLTSPSIRIGLVRSTGVGPDRAGDGFNIRLDGGTGTFGTLEAPTDILARFTAALAADTVRAGRDAVLASGAGTLALGTVEVQGVATLVGGALALRGTLSAAELRLVSTGPMRFGGAPGGTGFVFSAEDFARTTAPGGISASSGAVPRATTPQGPGSAAFEQAFGVGGNSDLVVDSFTFDPARVALFGFYAGAAASIRVIGDITPAETGGRIILGANPVEGLTPGAVLVSGSLGAGELFLQDCYVALFPLENIAITALGDVIFGSAAFQQAVAAADPGAIDVQAGTPGLPPSPADDRLWAVTETLSITAPGRIVSQNTSSVPGSYAGLVIANRQSPPLVPTVLTVTGGSVVDLSGVLVNGAGRAFFGPTAARSGAIAATNPAARFNSCTISGTDSCLPPLADPGLGFRPDQFLPPDPVPAEPFRLSGEILFLLGDSRGVSVLAEDGALFIRRDEEEERPDRAPSGR